MKIWIIINYKKSKTTTKLKKKKQYELKKRRALFRKQNDSNNEVKHYERIQNRENVVEDNDIGRFFEWATTNKRYVSGLKLQENKKEILEAYTSDFELKWSMLIGDIKQKTNIRFKNVDDFETHINVLNNSGRDSDDVFLQRGCIN